MNSLVRQLFHQLVDLPPEARALYFAENAIDEDIRREVESLIAFDSGPGPATEFTS